MVVEYFRMLQVSHPLGLALLPETAVVERSQVWIQGPGAVDDDTCFRILRELIQDVQPASSQVMCACQVIFCGSKGTPDPDVSLELHS
jgi:hypothetical protein